MPPICPFCEIAVKDEDERVYLSNDYAFAIYDGFPVSAGHTLIIPNRHVQSFFELSTEERVAVLELIDCAKVKIDNEFSPDAYNIGVNDGPAAGQTVNHLHIHLIPRYQGDVPDPRGGIRWVIPEKAVYWSPRDD